MDCFCEEAEIYELKVEGDVGADPIWCNQCGCNLDLEYVPISNELKSELTEWITKYGEWINWDIDRIIPNGIEMEEEHIKQGAKLTEKVKEELLGKYRIKFSPSTMARSYARKTP
ncbi:hypothetical protein GJU40_16515 [Bacillus lacus]|uniref:Uncharacterized protein n=2 Tax=Metabacillus lacus TaxID=1983721 RepID=A0A7X2LZS5_9BACI|nr:hypothetical protein [Metabacillus lacus]MRX73746.1 hypothetical protein [Metabacillus lacus]